MALTNTYCLKMTPSQFGQSSVVVNCSQYDSLFRVIQFNLYNGTNEFSIPDNCVVTIRGTKKDLTGFEYQCEYEGNAVTFPIQNQVTVLPGKVPAEIRVTSGNEIIGSWNFVFLVEESPLDENTIISETDLPLLESALEAAAQAESFKNLAEQSATDASTSATEASDSASTATTKAEESAESALKSEGYAIGEQNGEPVDETSIYYHNNAKWYSQSGGGGTHNYEALANKPSINNVTLVGDKSLSDLGVPTKTSELTNDSGFISSIPSQYITETELTSALSTKADTSSIPTKTSELTNDSGFISSIPSGYITESELSDELDNYATLAQLNTKADASSLSAVALSGSYNDLTNKPTIPSKTSQLTNDSNFVSDANYVHTDNNFTTTEKNKLSGIASGAEVNVQSDWNVTNTSSDAFIKNKPSIPTKTSELTNDSGFLTSAPVSSVDGKTGAVTVLPTGGTTGQVLAKASNTDRDVEWTTPSGGSSEWTLLVDTTLESDQSSSLTYRWDDEGGYSEIHYSIVAVGKTGLASAMDLIVLTENNQGNQPRFKIPLATSGYLLVYGHFSTNYLQHLQAKASVGGVTHNYVADITPYFTQMGRTGKIVVFWLLNSSTAYLPAGSQIKIWGKK